MRIKLVHSNEKDGAWTYEAEDGRRGYVFRKTDGTFYGVTDNPHTVHDNGWVALPPSI